MTHETVGTLQLGKENIELVETQLDVDRLSLILRSEQVQLEIDETAAIRLHHTVLRGETKLVVEVDKLRVVNLGHQRFQLLVLFSFLFEGLL